MIIAYIGIALLIGGILGYFIRQTIAKNKLKKDKEAAERVLKGAEV